MKIIRISPAPLTCSSLYRVAAGKAIRQNLTNRTRNLVCYLGSTYAQQVKEINKEHKKLYEKRLKIFQDPELVQRESGFLVTSDFLRDEKAVLAGEHPLYFYEKYFYFLIDLQLNHIAYRNTITVRSFEKLADDKVMEYSAEFPSIGLGTQFFVLEKDTEYYKKFGRNPTTPNNSIGVLFHPDLKNDSITLYRIGTYRDIFNTDLMNYFYPTDETYMDYVSRKAAEAKMRQETENVNLTGEDTN